jgi:hypothetical protein
MDTIKFFRIISRLNSVLFLLILLASAYWLIQINTSFGDRPVRGAVDVVEDPTAEESPTLELRLGRISWVNGTDTQYVPLETQAQGGKLSGYDPSETLNVLFVAGDSFDSHWLFDHQRYRIVSISSLTPDKEFDEDRNAVAIYSVLVKADTNDDGRLDTDDIQTIALLQTDGTGYTEVATNIEQIISTRASYDGGTFDVLAREGDSVVMRRYSLETFEKIQEKTLTELR